MLGKGKIKLIKSLSRKKQRDKHGLFVVEGFKSIGEFLDSGFELERIFSENPFSLSENTEIISPADLKKISNLTTPNQALALFKIRQAHFPNTSFHLALDGVRDPGNLGTIIRLCDWFGIHDLICSKDCADCYNPKTVQAAMGSLARVNVFYTNLETFIKNTPLPVYGTFTDGENIYSSPLPNKAVLVLGNEANGISAEIEELMNHRLSIPRFGELKKTESLNVASAAAIFLSEFCRR